VTGKSNYKINQADLDNGSVTNEAFAIGTFNGTLIHSNNVTATVTATQDPVLEIVKSASPTNYSVVGQIITYTYNVINNGNMNIKGPSNVTDNRISTFTVNNDDL
jgi:uncharacterized repeat protein (TIGR01451 family)